MIHDRLVTISYGNSRRSTNWQPQTLMLSELWEKLRIPVRSGETLAEYLNMKKGQQDDLKDVGGYVCGTFSGPRRKAGAVLGRDVITLDLDNIPAGETEAILRRLDGLGVGYCVYSTRKHHGAAPRLRVLIPLDRTVTADEYEPCARKMAGYIALEMTDATTFEAARLMYWPSCCRDSEFIYHRADKPFVSADGLLEQYGPDGAWRDVTLWPSLPGTQTFTRLAVKQGDPEGKTGVVGAFCRVYDIQRAMDELLPGIYEPVLDMPGRYTYLNGSTTGGAVLYDNGKFLYSHHATDPCGGRLVNSFDLVRLHLFTELDDEAKDGTPSNRLPSFAAMCAKASQTAEVSALMAKEDFAGVLDEGGDDGSSADDWTKQLTRDQNGNYHKTLNNIMLLVQNIPELRGCARRDDFSGRVFAADDLPWKTENGYWTDSDTTELRKYFETRLRGFKPSKQDVKDAVIATAVKQKFHPVRDYLSAVTWDGNLRLDTLFVDYLGVEDSHYTRAVTRKALVGAAARVMVPGCKFDYMLVFVGKQGRGKSSIIFNLAGGEEWFTDSLATFDGNKAFEAVTGKWLVEVPEMHAFDKVTMNQAKAFISKQSDFYRAAYAEFPEDRRRQCVFFGTTNNMDCLRDETGGRRFWPLVTDVQARRKNLFSDLLAERDQIWAEAVVYWRLGETLYLPPDLEATAAEKQEAHREKHPWEDSIRNFVEQEIPEDWDTWELSQRMVFWG
ncbi:MAG: virulence-associated E family protein, partial [Oscillospiraceae bacterium]|nr:virulence-associated E family protein [Oscillospiraceae bacterium]